jgi:hypothetical protein
MTLPQSSGASAAMMPPTNIAATDAAGHMVPPAPKADVPAAAGLISPALFAQSDVSISLPNDKHRQDGSWQGQVAATASVLPTRVMLPLQQALMPITLPLLQQPPAQPLCSQQGQAGLSAAWKPEPSEGCEQAAIFGALPQLHRLETVASAADWSAQWPPPPVPMPSCSSVPVAGAVQAAETGMAAAAALQEDAWPPRSRPPENGKAPALLPAPLPPAPIMCTAVETCAPSLPAAPMNR